MSSAPNNPPEDDVQRLLKQMNMAAFRFRSFDRPVDHDLSQEFDADAPAEQAEMPVPAKSPLVPSAPLRVAAAATPAKQAKAGKPLVAASPPPMGRERAPVDEAFGRLIRKNEPRVRPSPAFSLDLPLRPRIVEVRPAANSELLLTDVLNRLCRLGASKISLIRARGEA